MYLCRSRVRGLVAQPARNFPGQSRKAFPGKIAQPETVNFGEPPAKLLDKIYKQTRRHSYKKMTYGKYCSQSSIRRCGTKVSPT